MKDENKVTLTLHLSKDIALQLAKLAKQEKHSIPQQATLIIYNFFKDYQKMLELVNEKDFGTITEESLRNFLMKDENQIEYKYEDIKDYTFDELFKFWLEKFYTKK